MRSHEISFLCTWESTRFHFYVNGSPQDFISMYKADHEVSFLCIWQSTRFLWVWYIYHIYFIFIFMEVHKTSFLCILSSTSFWFFFFFFFFLYIAVYKVSFLCICVFTRFHFYVCGSPQVRLLKRKEPCSTLCHRISNYWRQQMHLIMYTKNLDFYFKVTFIAQSLRLVSMIV